MLLCSGTCDLAPPRYRRRRPRDGLPGGFVLHPGDDSRSTQATRQPRLRYEPPHARHAEAGTAPELAVATGGAIESGGGIAAAIAADVCDQAQVEALTGRVMAECGRIDVLVCNANTGQPPFVPLESLAWQDFIGKVTGDRRSTRSVVT